MSFELIPAIDLLDGRCVRLLHGDFEQCKHYDVNVAELAMQYQADGANWLHVVDLAASRDGPAADTAPLFDLLEKAPQSVQTGGGVRKSRDVLQRLENGAKRVVVGSICVNQPDRFAAWMQDFGANHLVAALDVRIDENGVPWPRTFGWTKEGRSNLWQLLDFYQDRGLQHLLCTDIGRDGAMTGPNVELYTEIIRRYPHIQLQASGGVSSLDDLKQLVGSGAASAITGKALLEGAFTVKQALEVVS